jgi:hypothetical protein
LHAAPQASEAPPAELRPAPKQPTRGLAVRMPAGDVGARAACKSLARSRPAGLAARAARRVVAVVAVAKPLSPEYPLAVERAVKKAGPEEHDMSRPCAIVARILDPLAKGRSAGQDRTDKISGRRLHPARKWVSPETKS